MTHPRHIAVIDIGKTNAKLALVDLETLTEISVVTRPNVVINAFPWPHFDTDGNWSFILDNLREFHREHRVDAISVTTHGASIVLLDQSGNLATPILDYEHPIPAEVEAQYDAIRPSFASTGSPRLAGGLNVGAQLHWQFLTDPKLLERTAHVIGYPQYWAYRLTGEVANDVTSIGCHTDLWLPHQGKLSELAATLGIAEKIAPVRKSGDVLGTILPEIATATGLAKDTPVVCGIHDSNASLLPHLLTQDGQFSVVSTGTWVVVLTVGGDEVVLDPNRDTLINVNAFGDPVPSARFMGGREFDLIQGEHPFEASEQDVDTVLSEGIMLMPAVENLTGPFQGQHMRWIGTEPPEGSGSRAIALSYYLALMTSTCLKLTGASGPSIIEGPFAQNTHFLAMLYTATGRPVFGVKSATGTSVGAAQLFGNSVTGIAGEITQRPGNTTELIKYAAAWRTSVGRLKQLEIG
ncbi:carbohydrate kinase [Sulfitobacter sp. SK012]|uniref:FGGY-family carbohydrate kinase n=1 Tax=Sulfitobacter sp. SK012 TaxID=1389005 RepID=UPI000E0BC15B|nr:FGGY-family carbohydrate kinase [Sulfitobacter sp. SK012]AXI45194.1 carbohydrate kinase [Sulfitobacter sp. SK012]